jgi:hypothetical protein
MGTVSTAADAAEAIAMIRSGLRFLATADATQMPAETQARCLIALEQADAMSTAARASVLAAFIAAQGYRDDGDYSARAWLMHHTRVTKATACEHGGWSRRTGTHPRVMAALATGDIVSKSFARALCGWTDRLPEDCRDNADAILVSAAQMGMDLQDLLALAAEIEARSRPDVPDEDGPRFEDRAVKLETTFGGAGVLTGDLSPECAAVVAAVLDALSAPRGAEDDRTHEMRYHDALEEACRRLVAAGLLPERAGQPVHAAAHIHLKDLTDLDVGSELQKQWTENVRAEWAAARAAASAGGSDGAAWLEGQAAEGFACDASVTPVVFGTVDIGVMEQLVRLCVQLAGHGPGRCTPAPSPAPCGGEPASADPDHSSDLDHSAPDNNAPDPDGPGEPMPGPQLLPPGLSRESLEQAVIGKAVELLSGPGGLASFLRRRELGARLGGPSQPLDIGYSSNVPAGIRKAVKARDKRCQWAGGCDQPASACEVHHLKHKVTAAKLVSKIAFCSVSITTR